MKKVINMALCQGRHEIPQATEGAIFENEIADPTNTKALQAAAYAKLSAMDVEELNLYVTGLTVALIAVINACKELGISLTLWHFDRETGGYFKQEVL